eukprot:SAG31_NODE_6438_length_2018_cov_3.883325_1_plen_238_part_00
MLDSTRHSAVYAAGVSFLLLVLSAGWLTFSHYFNYQAVKRDHATVLAFADAFKSMLERRRRRAELAFDRNVKTPRAEQISGVEEFAVDRLRPDGSRKRGKLLWDAGAGLGFVIGEHRNSVFIETERETWSLDQLHKFETIARSPPEVVVVLRSGDRLPFAAKDARAITSRLTRLLVESRGVGNSIPKESATFEAENGSTAQMQAMMQQQQQMMQIMMQQQQQQQRASFAAVGAVDDT